MVSPQVTVVIIRQDLSDIGNKIGDDVRVLFNDGRNR